MLIPALGKLAIKTVKQKSFPETVSQNLSSNLKFSLKVFSKIIVKIQITF